LNTHYHRAWPSTTLICQIQKQFIHICQCTKSHSQISGRCFWGSYQVHR
jgi:hypothetical protein